MKSLMGALLFMFSICVDAQTPQAKKKVDLAGQVATCQSDLKMFAKQGNKWVERAPINGLYKFSSAEDNYFATGTGPTPQQMTLTIYGWLGIHYKKSPGAPAKIESDGETSLRMQSPVGNLFCRVQDKEALF